MNHLIPLPHIWIQGMELFGGYHDTVAIQQPTNLNHECCRWQLWEVPSCLDARLLSKIHRWLLAVKPSLFPCLLDFACTITQIISTHCCCIRSALSILSECGQSSNVTKRSATAGSHDRSPSWSSFTPFCPQIIDPFFFSRNATTHTVVHLLNALLLACPILLAKCLKENSVCFRMIGGLPSAPPRSDILVLSSSASYSCWEVCGNGGK